MSAQGYTLFDTPIGPCGVAWGPQGLVGFQLPEANSTDTRARMARRFSDTPELAPPPGVRRALDAILGLLRGEGTDLTAIPLDMTGVPEFHRRVYEATRHIPPGSTLSYGEVAAQIGAPGAARAVGSG